MKVARLNVKTLRFLFLALRWREGLTSPVLSLLMDKSVSKVNLRIELISQNVVKFNCSCISGVGMKIKPSVNYSML